MAKLSEITNESGKLIFMCPGCKCVHGLNVNPKKKPLWKFNGNMDNPTIKPSLLVSWGKDLRKCHSFITDGKIQFLTDSTHELAGQTVDMEEWED